MNERIDPAEDADFKEGGGSPDDGEVRDVLPDDLDARGAGLVGPYVFPDNDRRRIPGILYPYWPRSRWFWC